MGKMWRNQNPHQLLVGTENRAAALENRLSAAQKLKHSYLIQQVSS